MFSSAVTWNGDNLEELAALVGIGRIYRKSKKIIEVLSNGGFCNVHPGDSVRMIDGDIEVYTCLVFNPVFRRWPA